MVEEIMLNKVTSTDVIVVDETSYDVAFKPYGGWSSFDPFEGGPAGVGLDAASPRIDITRSDQMDLSETDILIAEKVAEIACERHPDWRREKVFGPGRTIETKMISFMEVCK